MAEGKDWDGGGLESDFLGGESFGGKRLDQDGFDSLNNPAKWTESSSLCLTKASVAQG